MTISKSLYAAPVGIAQLDTIDAPDIEIEIEDDDIEDRESDPESETEGKDFNRNLVDEIDEKVLATLAGDLLKDIDDDLNARKDWINTYVDGIELLGLKMEERTEPWEDACGVYHPMLAEAVVKFQSETMQATFPAAGPVKTHVLGNETPDKREASERVMDDMNHQLMEVMTEYRPEHERMLFGLALSGNAFKKVYFDAGLNRQTSIYVPGEDVIVPYGASNLHTAARVTHVMRKTENELKRLQDAGFYVDVDLGAPSTSLDEVEKKISEKMGFSATTDNRYKLYECQADCDIQGLEDENDSGDVGYDLPYVITLEKGTGKVLGVRRNWAEGDKKFQKRTHFVHYSYLPGFGFYALGLVHLIGGFAKSATSTLRQLVDAGTLANLPGGLKARGMRIKGDDSPISPGEFRDVDIAGGNIRDSIMMLPYKEPSLTLFNLMNQIIDDGRRFANSADLQVADMNGEAPVGTTLALLERSLKVTSAIQSRIHYAMKQELGLLKEIIAEYTPEEYEYDPVEGDRKAKKDDYECCCVIPVSDPNASTMGQKIMQYQAAMQLAQTAPQMYSMPYLHQQMLEAIGIQNINKVLPMAQDQIPTDPVSENQNLLMMKPVKAFEYQDHQSHIAVHMAAMQDPKIMQLLQNNPQAPAIQAAGMAHVNEHLGFEYRRQIEQQLGMTLPPQNDVNGDPEPINPQVEARLSPLLAQAAQQLLSQNQAQVKQQQAQQQQQDPLVQLQQQEMQIKQSELQLKQTKQQFEQQAKQQELQLEAQRIQNQITIAQGQQKVTAATALAQNQQKRKQHLIDKGVEVVKHNADIKQRVADRKVGVLKDLAKGHREDIHHRHDAIADLSKAAMQEETKHRQMTLNKDTADDANDIAETAANKPAPSGGE